MWAHGARTLGRLHDGFLTFEVAWQLGPQGGESPPGYSPVNRFVRTVQPKVTSRIGDLKESPDDTRHARKGNTPVSRPCSPGFSRQRG